MNYKIEYTDNLPDWVGGRCTPPRFIFPFNLFGFGKCNIKIRKKYRHDKGIHLHEIEHAKQYKNNMFHIFRYALSKKYRYKCELEAYTVQLKHYGLTSVNKDNFAVRAIVEKYNLKVNYVRVVNDLNTRLS